MPAQLLINSHITYFLKKREQQWLSTLITKKTKMVLTQNKQQNTFNLTTCFKIKLKIFSPFTTRGP